MKPKTITPTQMQSIYLSSSQASLRDNLALQTALEIYSAQAVVHVKPKPSKSRITEQQAQEILNSPKSYKALAKEYRISMATISKIRQGTFYK